MKNVDLISKFVTWNWNIVNQQSNVNYSVGKKIIYSTEVLKFNLFYYNNAYILVRGNITIARNFAARVAFKNCASFIKFVKKLMWQQVDGFEDLYLVMPMYDLLECCSNFAGPTDSLWSYS